MSRLKKGSIILERDGGISHFLSSVFGKRGEKLSGFRDTLKRLDQEYF